MPGGSGHRSMIISVLRQLGHPVPKEEDLQRAIVTAAREVKSAAGIDPGPRVKLALVPILDNILKQNAGKKDAVK